VSGVEGLAQLRVGPDRHDLILDVSTRSSVMPRGITARVATAHNCRPSRRTAALTCAYVYRRR